MQRVVSRVHSDGYADALVGYDSDVSMGMTPPPRSARRSRKKGRGSPAARFAFNEPLKRLSQPTMNEPADVLESHGLSKAAEIFREEGIDAEFVGSELVNNPDVLNTLKFLGLKARDCIKVKNLLNHLYVPPSQPITRDESDYTAESRESSVSSSVSLNPSPRIPPANPSSPRAPSLTSTPLIGPFDEVVPLSLGKVADDEAGRCAFPRKKATADGHLPSAEAIAAADDDLLVSIEEPARPPMPAIRSPSQRSCRARGSICLAISCAKSRPGLVPLDSKGKPVLGDQGSSSGPLAPGSLRSDGVGGPAAARLRSRSHRRAQTVSPMSTSPPSPTETAALSVAAKEFRAMNFKKRLEALVADISGSLDEDLETERARSEEARFKIDESKPLNSYQTEWMKLKDAFPLPSGTLDRLTKDAAKFMHDAKFTNDLGYPTNQAIISSEFSPLFENINLNNIGSPYNLEEMGCIRNTRDYEREVLDMVAEATGISKDAVSGYITHGGTEAALYGLWNARQRVASAAAKQGGSAEPVMFWSAEAHYSCAKISNILAIEGAKIGTDESGAMSLELLAAEMAKRPGRPVIVMATVGTTFTESIDDVRGIKALLTEAAVPHWIHVDAAYLGMVLPWIKEPIAQLAGLRWSWPGGADSMSISGHKFAGTNVPCGVALARRAADGTEAGMGRQEYANINDNTISGCRNGNVVLELWLTFKRFYRSGFEHLLETYLKRAEYAYQRLQEAGMHPWRFCTQSLTICFDRPADEDVGDFYHLMRRGTRCHIMAHNTSEKQVDELIAAIQQTDAERAL